jgi:hypothetical protein
MGTVSYNGKKIIPAPLVNVQKSYLRAGDGEKIGSTFNITLSGRVISHKGSPNSSGVFWTSTGYPADESATLGLDSILVKQEALRHLFAEDGKSLEIQCPSAGKPPFKCYPKILDIAFPQGQWAQHGDYSITVEAPEVFGIFDSEDYIKDQNFFTSSSGTRLFLETATESWALETQEQPETFGLEYTYSLSHSLSAVGKKVYDSNGLVSPGWEQARDWVTQRMGYDNTFAIATSGLGLPSYYQPLNHVVTENTSEIDGNYSISETWILASGTVLEDCTISRNESLSTSLVTVGIEGNIQGLTTDSQNKFDSALTKWNTLVAGGPTHDIFTRAQLYAGITLNSTPLTNTLGKNPIAGSINYTYEYDDRPSNYIAGARSETVTISDTKPADVVGRVAVLGRKAGPVLQDIGTITEFKRNLVVEVVMPHYSGVAPTTPANVAIFLDGAPTSEVQVLVDAFDGHLRNTYNQVFVENDTPNWNPKTGQYSRNITWLYQDCILSAVTPPYSGAI